MAKVDFSSLTASLAVKYDVAILDVDDSLGVLAVLAKNELADEAVEVVLKLARVVSPIDNPAIVLGVDIGLSAKLETKVLDDIYTKVRT